ncbi:MAG: RsmG family class I SAM-dependent methyltransferase [Acidobacteriota bacterium]
MGSPIPAIKEDRFERAIERLLDDSWLKIRRLPKAQVVESLWAHFTELRLWNPKLSLIGPGTAHEILDRHYGESLVALSLMEDTDQSLVDLGSGGGFPGLVLAASAGLRVSLVEPRQRKCLFLLAALRRMQSLGSGQDLHGQRLTCSVLQTKVENPLPPQLRLPYPVDLYTSRALALSPDIFAALHQRSPEARLLLWVGAENERHLLDSRITSLYERGRAVKLSKSGGRNILELLPRRSRSA